MPIRPENAARYPKDWKARSRFVRFYRAKNRCEWCGCENYQPHPVTGSKVVLTVAHVFDDRPEASNLLNLAALCQRCHNRHDMKDRARRRRERIETESGQMKLCLANDERIHPHPNDDQ
jgi:5-methylcytosine-specific restriction endonuclease McrA